MPSRMLEPVKNRLFNWLPAFQVLDYNSLEQLRCDVGVPDPFRIDDDDRTIAADAEAGSLASLYARGAEQQILALQQLGEL